jgi:hypothetical protein
MVPDEQNDLIFFKVYENYKVIADDFCSIIGYLKENTLLMITCEDKSAAGEQMRQKS